MLVSDVLQEASEITGLAAAGPDSWLLYKKISRAIKTLATEGLWDAQQLYMDINVQQVVNAPNVVILPREVLSPIKITINRNPAFSRNRLYEFSLNGPGVQDALTGWQWMDQNSTPILVDLPSIGTKLQVVGDAADHGKKISFFGLDNEGNEVSDVITIPNDGSTQTTDAIYRIVRRVAKERTTKRVLVNAEVDGNPVANYYPDETEPRYRKIKLAKNAENIHMLFRRTTVEVTGPDDYIPLDSELAVLYAIRAITVAIDTDTGPSAEYENFMKAAVGELQKEQKARNSFAELAAADELPTGFNLNINNREVLIAADVIDDVFEIFGPIGLPKAFDRLTDVTKMLNDKSQWEGSEGYVDINVGEGGIVTQPRWCYRPVKINIGNRPAQMRNRWFEFHLDGPGSQCQTPCNRWDDLGQVVTICDPTFPFRLVALNDANDDDGATLTVYGYDANGRRVRTPNEDVDSPDKFIDGVKLTANYANTQPDPQGPVFSRIERIVRDQTQGFQQLIAYSEDYTQQKLIGYYEPDETEPNYQRIKLPFLPPSGCQWIRMRYRKRDQKVKSLTDPLGLKSRLAVVNGLRAVQAQKDNPDTAAKYEMTAVNYLADELATNNPSQQFSIEVDPYDFAPETTGMTF